ncbi:MAG: hypothetical protein ACXWCG_09755 [Flavitalea sp.]
MLKPIIVSFMLFTASCSNNQSKSETKETQTHATETNQAKLQLNNGEKWKLDEATRQNMKEIKAYISQATHANVLSGEELQKYTDKLIKECRMSGADHDAIHVWLRSFSQHVQALKVNRDAESASHNLNEDVKEFDTYFE